MSLPVLCLLCLSAQVPNLDKKVSCQILRAPLREVLQTLSEQTGVELKVVTANRDLSSTVLVKDKPLRQVLEALASVHGLRVDTESVPICLKGTDFKAQQDAYVKMENATLLAGVQEKLAALAKMASENPYSGQKSIPTQAPGRPESPYDWAMKRSHQWPYYLVGTWRRLPPNAKKQQSANSEPFGFWVSKPANETEYAEGCVWEDDHSAYLDGHQILFYISPITYQLRVVGVRPAAPPEPSPRFPYILPSPPASLNQTPFAKRLATWVTSTDKMDTSELNRPTKKDVEPKEPEPWFGDKTSLATVLRRFHDETGMDVVADAYRISVRTSIGDVQGRTAREWILKLRDKEACFTRVEPGMLLLRHPAFWRLQETEPTADSLRKIESIAPKEGPTVLDYADFTAANGLDTQVRFDSASTFLTKFDPTPLKESGPAFRTIGMMPAAFKARFAKGEVYSNEVAPGRNLRDTALTIQAAWMAPFYGASAYGNCLAMMRGGAQSMYMFVKGYDKFVTPPAQALVRYAKLELAPNGRSGELWLGFSDQDFILYKLIVP